MAKQPNNPFDMSQMFAMFEPDRMQQAWNPQAMMQMFQQPQAQMFDMEAIIRANQRNFEAMGEANKAAAEAYKDLLDKQMEIFDKLTHAARQQYEWADENAGPDAMKKRTSAMSDAVEESLKLMRKMADNAREANEEAYRSMSSQIEESVSKVEQTAKKAANKS